MKKLLSVLVLSALSLNLQANVFEDKVEQAELATALIRCASETTNVLNGMAFVRSVEGKHIKVSKRVDVKTYTLKIVEPHGFGITVPGPTVLITNTITQPPVGSFDMPAQSEFKCEVLEK